MRRKIIIAGTGCVLADYLYTGVKFDAPQFQKYLSNRAGDGGLSPGKLVFIEELETFSDLAYPEICKEITEDRHPAAFNIGGPGIVSLINTSQLLDKEKFEVLFYGGVGHDQTADLLCELLRKTHINIDHLLKVSKRSTPFTDVFSDSSYDNNQGERTFVNNIGAAWDYTSDFLNDGFFDADIVCFGGTALVPQIHDNLTALLKKAKQNKCITVVNTVFDFRSEKKSPGQPWQLVDSHKNYPLIDLLIMDCEESLKISGQLSIEKAAEYFIRQNIGAVIITNGSKELCAFSNGSLFEKTELLKLPVSRKVSEDLFRKPASKGDTTGCGDNFAGGVVASLAMQLATCEIGKFSLTEAIAWGVASGGFTCFYIGGTYFEKSEGEKLGIVQEFRNEYINNQISIL